MCVCVCVKECKHVHMNVTFEVYKRPILSSIRLSLSHNYSEMHCGETENARESLAHSHEREKSTFLSQIRFPFLHSSQYQIASPCGREPVKTAADPLHGYDIEVLGSRVVCTVHDGANRQPERNAEPRSRRSLLSCV